eukprot:GHVH01013020.1.p1 GENE.GHVH01013020.1~~GHVH01013020.1.p1  ORF type:complete len:260 (-),score=33.14 GHVH01013020.1:190-969(-)
MLYIVPVPWLHTHLFKNNDIDSCADDATVSVFTVAACSASVIQQVPSEVVLELPSEVDESEGEVPSEVDESEGEVPSEVDESEGEETSEVDESEGEVPSEVDESEGEVPSEVDESEDEVPSEVVLELPSEVDESEDEETSQRADGSPSQSAEINTPTGGTLLVKMLIFGLTLFVVLLVGHSILIHGGMPIGETVASTLGFACAAFLVAAASYKIWRTKILPNWDRVTQLIMGSDETDCTRYRPQLRSFPWRRRFPCLIV